MSDSESSTSSVFLTQTRKHLQIARPSTSHDRRRSRFEEEYLKRFHFTPSGEIFQYDIAPQLLKKKRDLAICEKNHEEAREKHQKWLEEYTSNFKSHSVKRQQLDLKQKDAKKTYKILQNDLKKIQEDGKNENYLTTKFQEELCELDVQEEEAKIKLNELDQEIVRLKPTAKFVGSLIQASGDHDFVEHISQRLESFVLPQELEKTEESQTSKIDDMRLQIIKKYNLIQELNEQINSTTKEKKQNEFECFKIYGRNVGKHSEYVRIISSIKSMCDFVFSVQNVAGKVNGFSETPSNVDQQLEIIEQCLLDVTYITSRPDFEKSICLYKKKQLLRENLSRMSHESADSYTSSSKASSRNSSSDMKSRLLAHPEKTFSTFKRTQSGQPCNRKIKNAAKEAKNV